MMVFTARSDAACGLQSDVDRHYQQYKDAKADLDEQELTQAEYKQKLSELEQARRLDVADTIVSRYRGSVYSPCLPLLSLYTGRP